MKREGGKGGRDAEAVDEGRVWWPQSQRVQLTMAGWSHPNAIL